MSKKKGDQRLLTSRSTVKTLAVKCYDEQLSCGWETVCDNITAVDPEYQVIAIKHDKDYATDNIWKPSVEKAHYHIIWRTTTGEPSHVSSVLNMLGINFRKGIDDGLWRNHGVETISNFSSYTTYLTHETEEAELAGKTKYPHNELISNLTEEDIEAVRRGYIRHTNRSISDNDMAQLDIAAYELGHSLKDFDEWFGGLDFRKRSHSKMKTVKQSYDRGINDYIKEHNKLTRLCIFIQGAANTGKTYATLEALKGKKVLSVAGGGTGKFDRLTPTTEALVIDDDTCENIFLMSDNYACWAYRRNCNNQCWTGKYFIITSNLSFEDYVLECNEKFRIKKSNGDYTSQFKALRSRFFICEVRDKKLFCRNFSTRGTYEDNVERSEMFKDFKQKFNECMGEYIPVDKEAVAKLYSGINDDFFVVADVVPSDKAAKALKDKEAELIPTGEPFVSVAVYKEKEKDV